jgi:hypothetical protein
MGSRFSMPVTGGSAIKRVRFPSEALNFLPFRAFLDSGSYLVLVQYTNWA